jgi:hypothetical protein
MASGFTTTTSLAVLIPEITDRVDYIFQNASIGRSLVKFVDISGQAGKAYEYPIFTEVAASTGAGETATPTSHAMAVSSATLTVAKRVVYVGLGDLTEVSVGSGGPGDIAQAMGMAKAKAIDTSIFGVISTTDYATSAGATDAALSITHSVNALNALQENEVDGQVFMVVHPHQYKALITALSPHAATTSTTDIKIASGVSDEVLREAFAGRFLGMDWFVTNRVSSRTVDSTSDCWSGLAFSPRGIGYAYKRMYTDGIEIIRSDEQLSKLLLAWADSAGVIYASGVCTVYSTSG